jgi:hypothetical protein
MATQQANAGTGIQELLAANLAQNTTGKRAAIDSNIAATQAARGSGANRASAYMRTLQDKIDEALGNSVAARNSFNQQSEKNRMDAEIAAAKMVADEAANSGGMTGLDLVGSYEKYINSLMEGDNAMTLQEAQKYMPIEQYRQIFG